MSRVFCILLVLVAFAACRSELSPEDVPVPAQYQQRKIPFDQAYPRFLLAVEPVKFAQKVLETEDTTLTRTAGSGGLRSQSFSGTYTTWFDAEIDREAGRIATKLVSAFSAIENIAVIDRAYLRPSGRATYRYNGRVQNNERGPYIVRCLVTEYSAVSEGDQLKLSAFSLLNWSKSIQSGMVGIDVSLIDARSGAVVASLPIQGTFSSDERKTDFGIYSPAVSFRSAAKSVMEQAVRAAIDEAAKKTWEVLQEHAA